MKPKVPITPEAEEYRRIAEHTPVITRGWVVGSDDGAAGSARVIVTRSTPDIAGDASRTFLTSYTYTSGASGSGTLKQVAPFPTPLNDVSILAPSPSGRYMALLRTKKGGGGADKDKQFIEIWDDAGLVKSISTAGTLEKVMTDGWFGGVSWCDGGSSADGDTSGASEGAIAFVGKPKEPKRATFWDEEGDAEQRGKKFEFVEDWGEKYTGVSTTKPFVLFWRSGRIKEVGTEGVPEGTTVGQVTTAPDGSGVVFTGWSPEPRRLGMIYCYQRPCRIYRSPMPADEEEAETEAEADAADGPAAAASSSSGAGEDGDAASSADKPKATLLTPDDTVARSPVFDPTGRQLAYLACNGMRTHNGCSALKVLDVTSGTARVVVDVVGTPADNDAFPGLFTDRLPARCWSKDGSSITLTSLWRSQLVPLRVSVSSGDVEVEPFVAPADAEGRKTGEGASCHVLDVAEEGILMVTSTPASPDALQINGVVQPRLAPSDATLAAELAGIKWHVLSVQPKTGVGAASQPPFHSTLLLPPPDAAARRLKKDGAASSSSTLPPLLVFPHGGPHSCYPTQFFGAVSYQVLQGYAVLVVNYRGSTGFGAAPLNTLPGNCGTNDVSDVFEATKAVLAMDPPVVDATRVGVTGGSHGGFLTTHSIGQHPEVYKAAAARNPVTNISAMAGVTDIPDWCAVEAGTSYEFGEYRVTRAADLARMFAASPAAHMHNVVAPTLLLLGAVDRRVPVSQGLDFYHALKSQGTTVSMQLYPEDCHALDKPGTTADSQVCIVRWFNEHL